MAITICSGLPNPSRSLSSIVCRGQEGPKGSKDIYKAGHSLIYSRFAIRSPLNFFPRIADALAFIFWIAIFARRSIAHRSASGSLSDKR